MVQEGHPTQEDLDRGRVPLGPDVQIFRSQQELDEYIDDWFKNQ